MKTETLLKLSSESYDEHNCKVGETECMVSMVDGIQVVAFRGTEGSKLISGDGWRDVVRDIRLIPWYDKRVGWSHSGFLKGARSAIEKGLFGMLRRDTPIILTGHSLGGALAINAAMILHADEFSVIMVETFGAPRTLLRSSVKRFKKTGITVREYSNAGDPVPDVPFRWWGYRHINEVKTARQTVNFPRIKNHLMKSYLEAFSIT